jgi:hypothetical protein
MYVIRDRKTKAVLDIAQSVPGETKEPKEVFPGFDPDAMEFGRSETAAIPARFEIERGIVKEVEEPKPAREAAARVASAAELPPLDELKASLLAQLSEQSFVQRRALIPEHELQNAALGIYDEPRTAAIRATVKAFRDEYHRLEEAIGKAKSPRDLQTLKLNFPTQLVASDAPPATPPVAKKTTRKPTDL